MEPRQKILSVSELTRDLKEVLENVFGGVAVLGEVSNLRRPSSGHIYFSLKDKAAQIRCVLFRNSASRLKFQLLDGMQVVLRGRVGIYEKEGQYQLYADTAEPQGRGALQLALEQLKTRLGKEGLFDEARKKELPFLPRAIGIVTSPTGAVIRDILHVLERRFGSVHVIINPVRVQGDGSKEEIAGAIEEFNRLKCVDVIILARGGGSLEDLWSFNEEVVARAIYNSGIPVISAIGHETDYTIADFVADCRAPTPSAAAEIVMPSRAELNEKINNLLSTLRSSLADVVPQYSQRIDDLSEGLFRALDQKLKNHEVRLEGLLDSLNALSPLAILRRGYSITSLAGTGAVLHSADGLKPGEKVKTRLHKGEFASVVTEIVI